MIIKLKKDWDVPIQPPIYESKGHGYFAGREREVELLINEILHKNQGSILVSGYRGVGKTSAVYKALLEAKKKQKDIRIVLMNAAQLEAESTKEDNEDDNILPEKIIQNLIRRLYSSMQDEKLKKGDLNKKIENLYRKAVASEFKLRENYQHLSEKSDEQIKEENRDILFSENNIKHIILVFSWTLAVVFQVYLSTKIVWLDKLLPLLFALPIPFTFNLWYKKRRTKRNIDCTKEEAGALYEYDNSISNLEFDLENIHKELYGNGIKLVYVIDELDKLDTEKLKDVLKYFKNLFTLSKAIFIFVSGEEFFSYIIATKPERPEFYRSKEYTYFTSKYFFARPLWNDLSKYLDDIVESKELGNIEYEILKHSFVFDSINDFFDLIRVIKDNITGFDENGYSIIKIDKLEQDVMLKARLHKSITLIFEEKYLAHEPSKWHENENILRTLYSHVRDNISSKYSGQKFNDINNDTPIASAIRDFNALIYRLGALTIITESQESIRGLLVPIRAYQYIGNVENDPPINLTVPSEIEKRFIDEFKKYCDYIISINNILLLQQGKQEINNEIFWKNSSGYVHTISDLGFDASSQFNSHFTIYQNLISRIPPYPYKREDIEQRTEQIISHTNSMFANLYIVFDRITRDLYSNLNLKNQQLSQNGNLFVGSADQVRKVILNYAHVVLFNQQYSRQIIFIPFTQAIINSLKQISKVIEDNAATHKIFVIGNVEEKIRIKGMYVSNCSTPDILVSSSKYYFEQLKNEFFKI
ncbi:MAG: P-loop NTPase fold protein [Elusimicrobia bacterium]|nr:P-loop NTPase fold protein [Elusimicrobiota bacterium]